MLEIYQIKKNFGSRQVLDGISFTVPDHCIYGFVGENGAGKTTTMKLILGLLKADEGTIYVNGEEVQYGSSPTNRFIGYLPDVPEFYNYMTPQEYLYFCGEITGMDHQTIVHRTNELLNLVGLGNETKRIKGYSRGMRQRLGIAQALFHKPKLLICDEPTSALDPVGRKEILDILVAAKQETTVLFSTHILSDVERICDQIAFLHEGKIVLSGEMNDIKSKHQKNDYELQLTHTEDVKPLLSAFPFLKQESANTLLLTHGTQSQVHQILEKIVTDHISIENFQKKEWCLEDLFMEVINR